MPTGTVSFLFTDVAGSTRLWDTDRDGMARSLAVHDRNIERVVTEHGGHVFSTAGDSIAAAFSTASAAVAAAIQAQLTLLEERWPGPELGVRMAVHTGDAELRDGRYFGPNVTRTARVMGLANPGQILVSASTAALVAGELDEFTSLEDRGIHALKGFDRPEHVHEVLHVGLPLVANPFETGDRLHLPMQLSSFVGRHDELATVGALLGSSRLVTLTGAGGSGKSRLAVEAAAAEGDRFPDGVWMVELAPLSDPSSVADEVAALWGLRPGEGADPIEVIAAYLQERRLLLVVDNCEHVLSAAIELVTAVLMASTRMTVLATSRESLGIPGEAVYRVPSLALPSDEMDPRSDAVALFLDRAVRVLPGFTPSALDMRAIARICRRVDGMPLGIELAAARLRTLTPAELADRLEGSFEILTGGSKAALPRQRTLQATIDWSYGLLDEAAAAIFRRVSVFAGGFDLMAAESVAPGGGVGAQQVIDLLDQLVDKSLVGVVHGTSGARFKLLEPIRQYAWDRLLEAGEADETRLAHARYYAALVAATAPRLRGPEQREANDELLVEHDNIRDALSTLSAIGMTEEFLQACVDLLWFWAQSSLQVEGRDRILVGLVEQPDRASPMLVAKAWWVAALLAVFLTDPKGIDYADRGVDVARSIGDAGLIGWLYLMRGVAGVTVGSAGPEIGPWFSEARRLLAVRDGAMWDVEWDPAVIDFLMSFDESATSEDRRRMSNAAISRAKALGDRFLAGTAMLNVHRFLRDPNDPWLRAVLDESTAIMRELGFRHGLGHALLYLGEVLEETHEEADGLAELAEAAMILAEVGDLPCSTWSALQLTRALAAAGRIREAWAELAAVASRLLPFEREVVTEVAAHACRVALAEGDPSAAARFLGHAETFEPGSAAGWEGWRHDILDGLSDSEFRRLRAEGTGLSRRQMLQEILEHH